MVIQDFRVAKYLYKERVQGESQVLSPDPYRFLFSVFIFIFISCLFIYLFIYLFIHYLLSIPRYVFLLISLGNVHENPDKNRKIN